MLGFLSSAGGEPYIVNLDMKFCLENMKMESKINGKFSKIKCIV